MCIELIHLGSGRHFAYIEYVLSSSTINTTEALDFAAHIIYTTTLAICRLSGLAFYSRLTDRQQKLTWSIRAAAVFIIAAYLPQVFLIIFHCLPVTALWPYSFQPEVVKFTCLEWGTVYVTNSAISVICDLILFSLPIAIITSLHISLARKLKLSTILMPGLLVIAISSARMYLVVVGQWEADESWSYDYLLAIEVSEIGSTLLALSVPALKPLFGSIMASLGRTLNPGTVADEQSKIDTYARDRQQQHSGRGIELGSAFSRARDRVLGRSNESRCFDSEGRETRPDALGAGHRGYSAGAFATPEERKLSMGSATSQQPIIQRAAHDQAG